MSERTSKALQWAPRILILAFAAFLTIFSLDVFQENQSLAELAVDLLAHNLPSLLLVVIAAVAWKWPWVGAVACAALGVFYIAWAWGAFPLSAYVTISGPLFLVAILFAISARNRQ